MSTEEDVLRVVRQQPGIRIRDIHNILGDTTQTRSALVRLLAAGRLHLRRDRRLEVEE